MNIIFTPLNQLIKKSKEMKTIEDRREFEKEFDMIVNNYITDYTILSKNYLKVSDSFKIINKDPVLGFPSNIDNKYPYLYDLFSVNTISIDRLKNILDSIDNACDLYILFYLIILKQIKNILNIYKI